MSPRDITSHCCNCGYVGVPSYPAETCLVGCCLYLGVFHLTRFCRNCLPAPLKPAVTDGRRGAPAYPAS